MCYNIFYSSNITKNAPLVTQIIIVSPKIITKPYIAKAEYAIALCNLSADAN